MSKIKVKVIPPETIEVFNPDGTSWGKLYFKRWTYKLGKNRRRVRK
jgi:hypothetical protein